MAQQAAAISTPHPPSHPMLVHCTVPPDQHPPPLLPPQHQIRRCSFKHTGGEALKGKVPRPRTQHDDPG